RSDQQTNVPKTFCLDQYDQNPRPEHLHQTRHPFPRVDDCAIEDVARLTIGRVGPATGAAITTTRGESHRHQNVPGYDPSVRAIEYRGWCRQTRTTDRSREPARQI